MGYQLRAKRKTVLKTLKKYGGMRCCWCGKGMQTTDPKAWDYRTIEHLRPKSIGGKDDISNVRFAHKQCNNERARKAERPRYPSRLDKQPLTPRDAP